MGRTKALNLGQKLLFILLVLFPFGQLIRLPLSFPGQSLTLQPVDIIAGLLLLLILFSKTDKPKTLAFGAFFLSLFYSFIFSTAFFKVTQLIPGALYLLRLVSYYSVFILVWNLSKAKKGFKELVLKALLLQAVAVGVFGWYQYFVYPDLTSLKFLGWDDHLFRLVSTFLDPGFTGLILALGFLISLAKFLGNRRPLFAISGIFLFVTTIFTYARSAYVGILAGVLAFFFLIKKTRLFVFVFLGLLLVAIFLPRPGSEGVQLERLSSVYARVGSYKEAISLIRKSPMFGFGYNNICLAKNKFLGPTGQDSHSCSGFDSSILVLLSSLGTIGLIIFAYLVFILWTKTSGDIYGIVFKSSLIAVFAHSLFTNSLFYPWVLAWMTLLLGVSFKETS